MSAEGKTLGELANDMLLNIDPPTGRAQLSIAQRIAVAQVYATLDLAEQQRAANLLLALQHSALVEEQTDKRANTPATRYRVTYRNEMRREVQQIIGHVLTVPTSDGE